MTDNETNNNTDYYDYEYDNEMVPSAPVQFWTYLIFEIPSLFCTIYLLFYLIFNRHLRRQLHNHVIIVLLVLCLVILVVDNSFYLDGWRTGGHGSTFPSSSSVCLLWWFIDYGFYGAITIFLVWASLERHILVFHRRRFLTTKRNIFFVHYLPLILLSLYLIGFYTGVIVFPPCKNIFYYNSLACGSYPCYQDVSWLNAWDYLFHGVVCNILEAVFSISLLLRTIWKKLISNRRLHWKKYRKMTIQLLSISTLSLCINFPQSLIVLIQQIDPGMADFGSTVEPYFFYLTGYVILLLPFVCLGCLPELWPRFCQGRQRRMIEPMSISAGVMAQTVFVRRKDA